MRILSCQQKYLTKIFSPHLQMGTWKRLWIHIISEAAVHVVPIYWFVLYWLFNTRLHCFLFCDILWLNIDWDIIHLNSALTTHSPSTHHSHTLSLVISSVTISYNYLVCRGMDFIKFYYFVLMCFKTSGNYNEAQRFTNLWYIWVKTCWNWFINFK